MSGARRRLFRPFKILLIFILVIVLLVIGASIYIFSRLGTTDWDDDSIYMNNISDSNIDDYTNIALFGVDSRDNELDSNTRSDSIMIASINKKNHDIKLVSIYRDTYVYIDGHGYNKLNHAYAYGGPKLAVETINRNFDLNVTDFITINFSGLTDVIDALGGITLTIEEDELEYVNKYAKDVSRINNMENEWTKIKKPGKQVVTGVQATGYSRVRYTKGGDFTRTMRQRNVILAILDKARKSNPATLAKAANSVLPQLSTGLSSLEFAGLSLFLPFYSIEDQTGFPFDNTPKKVSGADVIVCSTLVSNVTKLHEYLFGTNGYVPSDTVKSLKQF